MARQLYQIYKTNKDNALEARKINVNKNKANKLATMAEGGVEMSKRIFKEAVGGVGFKTVTSGLDNL